MTQFNPAKQAELQDVALKYQNYKGLRSVLRQELEVELERRMAEAKEEFSTYLQNKIDRDGYPYKVYIADLMRAMNTTNRGTVLDFVKDARKRAEERRVNNFINQKLPLVVIGTEMQHDMAVMYVEYEGTLYKFSYRTGDGGSYIFRYQEWTYGEDGEPIEAKSGAVGREYRRRTDLTSDVKEKGEIPEWVKYAVETDEWKAIATNF